MTSRIHHRRVLLKAGTVLASGLAMAIPSLAQAQALPQNGAVVGATGTAVIVNGTVGPVPTPTTVTVATGNPVITWDSFNVGAANSVQFLSAPGAHSVLNRVVITPNASHTNYVNPAQIDGSITAPSNLTVWLVDPSGITFGPTGAFSGGSLVLSTLDISDAEFNAGASQHFFTPADGNPTTHVSITGTSPLALTLSAGAGQITSPGSIVLIGQQVDVGKTVTASGTVSMIAAADVTFASSVGSPLSYTINAGTPLNGVHVLGAGTISGTSVTVGAVSQAGGVASLLQVDSGANLTATAAGGTITLATKTVTTGANTATITGNNDGIALSTDAAQVAGKGLHADGATGAVNLAAAGAVDLRGGITAGADYTLSAKSVALAGTQAAGGAVDISATGGNITSDPTLVLTANSGNAAGTSDLVLDAGAKTVTLGSGSQLAAGLGRVGLVYGAGKDVQVGDVTAAALLDAGGSLGARTFGTGLGTGIAIGNFTGGSIVTGGALDVEGTGDLTATLAQSNAASVKLRGANLRLGSAVAATTLDAGATGGDLTGLSVGTPSNGLDTGFGRADLSAGTGLTATATGLVQGGTVATTGGNLAVTGGDATHNGAVDLTGASATAGTLTLHATAIAPVSGAHTGAILVGSGGLTASSAIALDNTVGGGNSGNITVTGDVNTGSTVAVTTPGLATLTGNVGNVTAPTTYSVTGKSITLGGAGAVVQKAGSATLTSNLANGTITLGNGLTLDTTGGDLSVSGTAAGTTIDGKAGSQLTTDPGSGGSVVIATTATGTAKVLSAVSSDNQYTVTAKTIEVGGTTQTAKNLVKLDTSTLGGTSVTTDAGLTLKSTTNQVQVAAGNGATLNADVLAGTVYQVVADNGDIAMGGSGATQQGNSGVAVTATLGNIDTASGLLVKSSGGSVGFQADAGTATILSGVSAGTTYGVTAKTIEVGGTAQTAAGLVKLDTASVAGGTSVTTDEGLTLTSSGNAVQILAGGAANLVANVSAGTDYTVSGSAVNLAIGASGPVSQGAAGKVDMTASAGDITGGARLTLTSNSGGAGAGNYLVLDAAAGPGTITLAAGSKLVAGTASVGLAYGAGKDVKLGDVTAATLGEATGAALARAISASLGGGVAIGKFTGGTIVSTNALGIKATGLMTIGTARSTSATVTLDNAAAAADLAVSGKVIGATGVTLKAGRDLLVSDYDQLADTGYVQATAGTVSVTAGRSVGTLATPLVDSGIAAISAAGNLTVNDTGDLHVQSLSAGGNLALNVTGALLGATGPGTTGTSVAGAAIFAKGAAGGVTVAAGQATPVNDVIALNQIETSGNVSLTGDTIAVGTVKFDNAGTGLTTALPVGGTPGTHYFGLLSFATDAVLNLTDPLAGSHAVVATENVAAGPVYNAERFDASSGLVNLTAGSGDITGSIGFGAQLGTVGANGKVQLTTGGLVATSLTATNGLVDLTASTGTLSLLSASAHTTLGLTKLAGSAATAGDDLRLVSGTSGGAATLQSSTGIRVGGLTAASGALTLTATTGDITGLIQPGASPVLPIGDVTTGTTFTASYGSANLTASAGDVSATASAGIGQLGTLSGNNVTAQGTGLTVASATAGSGTLSLTATDGTLYLGTGTAPTSASFTKSGAAVATGNDLRIVSFIGAAPVTIDSATSVRIGSVSSTSFGNIGVTAHNGDISGLLAPGGTAGALPTVSAGSALSANYGKADISSSFGVVQINAASGGVQAGTLNAGLAMVSTSAAFSADTITTGIDISVTATNGTLTLGSGDAAGGNVHLTKSGTPGGAGDELRVGLLTERTPIAGLNTVILSSSTSARIGSASTLGSPLTVTATQDVTGLAGASVGTSDTAYGRAVLGGVGGLTVTAGGLVQGGAFSASAGALSVAAGNATQDGSIDLASVSASGNVTLKATAITPVPDAAHDGDILVGGTIGGAVVLLDNTVNGGNTGLIQVGGAITSTADTTVRSVGAARLLGDVTAGGAYGVNAVGDITLGGTAQMAKGTVTIASSAGNLVEAAPGLVLTANSDQLGAEPLALSAAGSVGLGNTQLIGGSTAGHESAVSVNAGTTADIGLADGASLFVRAGGTITAHGALAAGNATLGADPAAGPATIDLANTAGNMLLVSATTTGTGHGIALDSAGDVTGLGGFSATPSARPSLSAAPSGANIAVVSGGASQFNSVAAGAALSVTAGTATSNGAIMINSASAGGALTLDAMATTAGDANHNGAITLDSASAGGQLGMTNVKRGGTLGDVTVNTGLTAGTDALVDAAGNIQLAQASATKTLALRSGGTLGGLTAGSAVSLTAGEDLAVKAGGAVTIGAASAGDDFTVTTPAALSVASASASGAGADTRSVDFSSPTQIAILSSESLPGASIGLTSTGASVTTSGALAATNNVTVAAGDQARILGAVTAGGNYAVTAANDVTLGGAGAVAQSAKGSVAITSSAGNVGQGAGPLSLTANLDGTVAGAEPLAVTAANSVALGGTDLVGGSGARESAITLTATNGAATIGTASGARFVATAKTGFTANGAITAGNATLGADAAGGPATADVTVSNGDLTTTTVTVTGAGHDIHLGASGTIATGALSAARAITVGGNTSSGSATSFTAASVAALAGDLTIKAGAATIVGAATSGGATAVTTSGASQFGSINAGGPLTIQAATLTSGATASGGAMGITTGGLTHLASATSGGAMTINAGTLTVDGAAQSTGSSIGLTTSGATQLGSVSANGPLTIQASTLTSGATASGGAMGITTGGLTHLASATSGGAMTINGGTLTVDGAAQSTGSSIGLTTSGAAQLGSVSANGPLTIQAATLTSGTTSAGGALTTTTTGATTLGATTAGGVTTIGAGSGDVALASLASGGATSVSGGSVTITGTTGSGGVTTVTAGTGGLSLGNLTSSGDVTLGAKTTATLGGVAAAGKKVTVTAADATVGGTVTAATVLLTTTNTTTLGSAGAINATDVTLTAKDAALGGTISATNLTIVDNGASGNALLLGDATGTGFQLSEAELNRLSVGTLTLDAGTGTGLTAQNVAIGNLNLTNATLKTLVVYGLGRVDLTGKLAKGTGSGLTTLQIGGNATSGTRASVIALVAKADGTGGLIDLGNAASLDLRGDTIGAGLDAGFLGALGVTNGSSATQTAAAMVSNAGSSLYSAQIGGAPYVPGTKLIIAGNLTVRYSNFALFQNTGLAGANDGVVLGSAASPAVPGLTIIGPNPPDAGPFGIFGQINGVGGIPTALLGPAVIQVTAVNRTTARINGCLIGSGAGCLTSLALSPSLGNLTPAPTTIIVANSDFLIPFDPLVATNNDSLFGDVGTFGLGDIAEPPVDCGVNAKDSNCGVQKEGAPK